jgi:hypothetical protein
MFLDEHIYSFHNEGGSGTVNGVHSPELKRQRQAAHNHQVGMSASPQFPSLPLEDSPGSAYGSAHGSAHSSARTPDGVNAQSSVQNLMDINHSARRENRTVKTSVKADSQTLSGDMSQLAEVIRGVVREELAEFKKDMINVMMDDMVDQLHRDIITLQAEMLIQFQIHQVKIRIIF